MQTKLTWKKKFFSDLYSIYSNGQQIGKLKDNTFHQSSIGELNGKEYTFKTKGFFKQHSEIIDNSENKVIGKIIYNNWMTKASILIDRETINWKYENPWNTKWSIYNSEGIKIKYSGSSTSGQIDSNTDNALLILSGLFVTNYYWQITMVTLIAVFISIGTTILVL